MGKKVITIPYDPKEFPEVEVYFIDTNLAATDKGLWKANERMKIVYSEIIQILKYVGFDPSVVLKKRTIKRLGEPHFVPVIYVNGVLFSTVYNFDPEKFLKVMEQMKKMRDEYFAKLYKNMDQGYIVYPNEHFMHVKDPMYVNFIVSARDMYISQKLGLPVASVDPSDELPATGWLIQELKKQGVPVTPVGFATKTKYKVLVMPEPKPVEL